MPLEQRDCEADILKRFDQRLPTGATAHFVQYNAFDAGMMIDCTQVSSGRDVYFAEAPLHDASVRFSRHTEAEGQSYFVTVHGGSNPTREDILRQFQEHLGPPIGVFQQLVVEESTPIMKHIYVWSVKNA